MIFLNKQTIYRKQIKIKLYTPKYVPIIMRILDYPIVDLYNYTLFIMTINIYLGTPQAPYIRNIYNNIITKICHIYFLNICRQQLDVWTTYFMISAFSITLNCQNQSTVSKVILLFYMQYFHYLCILIGQYQSNTFNYL